MTQLEADIWIENMENHFGSNLISRKYEVEHALQYFTQSVVIWWKMHHAIQGFSGAETWDEFKKTLLRSHLIQKCYDNPKKKTCACKIRGEIRHTQEEQKDGCTHCEENHPAEECPCSQKEAMKETLKKKILEEPVMNENIEDPDGQGLTRFFSNACYSCGEEGHYSQDCTKESQEYLGNFPMEKVEFDPLEIEELAKIKESGKKKKYPRKSQISADIDLSHMTTLYESFLKGPETIMTLTSDHDYPKILKDMMKHIHLEGDAVYKGYPFMESGVELWEGPAARGISEGHARQGRSPGGASPAKEGSVGLEAKDLASATDVSRERAATPPSLDEGSFVFSFCLGEVDADLVIEEIALDAAVQADKVAIGETMAEVRDQTAQDSMEESAKDPEGHAGTSSTAATKEAMLDAGSLLVDEGVGGDHPSSKAVPPSGEYIHAGKGQFVSPPRMTHVSEIVAGVNIVGEVFTADGLEVVTGLDASGSKLGVEQLFLSMEDNLRQLEALYRVRKEKLDSRAVVVEAREEAFQWCFDQAQEQRAWLKTEREDLLLKYYDIQKEEEEAKTFHAAEEVHVNSLRISLDAAEEDIAGCKKALNARLHAKDEEVERLVVQRTQELVEQHKNALATQVSDFTVELKKMVAGPLPLKGPRRSLPHGRGSLERTSTS
ncbi:hypothetical protein D1007_29394 [Hordeum vulgare]|nr:hypothetical protein D1007_29394 [Hordeum vulgare]